MQTARLIPFDQVDRTPGKPPTSFIAGAIITMPASGVPVVRGTHTNHELVGHCPKVWTVVELMNGDKVHGELYGRLDTAEPLDAGQGVSVGVEINAGKWTEDGDHLRITEATLVHVLVTDRPAFDSAHVLEEPAP